MRKRLLQFADTDITNRMIKIINTLDEIGVDYEVDFHKKEHLTNIVVKLNQVNKEDKVVVLGAHYDVVHNSTGLNDNGAAVVMLLEYIKYYIAKGYTTPLEIVFFDREETGMVGSDVYARSNVDRVKYALIFDIIAYGDRLVYGPAFDAELDDLLNRNHHVERLNQVLPSDNSSFAYYNIPTSLIVAAPDKDLIAQKDGSYNLVAFPEFYSSFHNRINDNKIDVLNFGLMKKAIQVIDSLF